jgi:TAK1-binding protein 1
MKCHYQTIIFVNKMLFIYSGVGLSTNQIYREDGYRQQDHEFEDGSFHCQLDDETFLYGVFDGHEGVQVILFLSLMLHRQIIM